MFYKFIDKNTIQKAPKPLKMGSKDIFTNSEQIHNEREFYRLVNTEYPQDGKTYKPIYTLENNVIVKGWVETEDTRTYQERVVNRIREKYSVDDELAILRQRDTKPEEFAEYYNYVENIKHQEKSC